MFKGKKTKYMLSVLCTTLVIVQSCQMAMASKTITLNLESREINGSVIDQSRNFIIVPNAEKLGINKEIKIKPSEELIEEGEVTTIQGEYNENGELVIDITQLGPAHSLPSGTYVIAAQSGRKNLVTKFNYNAPRVIKGILEVPVPSSESELAESAGNTNEISNAIVSINNAKTRKAIEAIKPVLIPGSQVVEVTENGKITKNQYQVIAEIPGNLIKELSTFELKAQLDAPTTKGTKRVTLSTLGNIDENNEDNVISNIKINAATTTALNIINATKDKVKELNGESSDLSNTKETFDSITNLLSEVNNAETIDLAIKDTKTLIKGKSKDLFATLVNYVKTSPSITSLDQASKVTIDISFDSSLESKNDENKPDLSGENVISLLDVVKNMNGLDSGKEGAELINSFIEKLTNLPEKTDKTALEVNSKSKTLATI